MFIGVDFGTQGVRLGVISAEGDVITSFEKSYNTYYPKEGWAEQKPADWLESFDEVMKSCLSELTTDQRNRLKGITVCTTASTVLPVDIEGNALTDAILWMDIRSKNEAREITATKSETLKFCGGEISPEWFLAKALWIKRHRPDLYAKAARIVEFQDYMNYFLTGEWSASICQATCKATYVEDFGHWDSELMNQIGLEDYQDKFNMNVLRLGEKAGELRQNLADEFGIGRIPVYQGGVDAYIGLLGVGVCRPGDIGIAMGTSFVQLALTDKLQFSEKLWGPYNNAIVPGLFALEGGQISAGSITKWFIKEFHVEGENKYMVMADEASTIDPGSDGIVVLDSFQGNRTPYKDPDARGVFYGLTLAHTRAHMYRAVLESVAFGTRNVIESIEEAGVPINRIFTFGGVTKNDFWIQMIADVVGHDLTMVENFSYVSLLGCAVIAAFGSGTYESFDQAVEQMVRVSGVVLCRPEEKLKYEASFNKYKALYQALKPLSD